MAALAVNFEDFHEPDAAEIDAARVAARQLSKVGAAGQPVSFVLEPNGHANAPEPITVPANIFRSIVKMLIEVGNGNAVAVVPIQGELTTQQAADLLNVSRPHLIKLLERDELKCRMVGTHRKLIARDVLTYRDKATLARREALTRMVEADEELGLYADGAVGAN